jgi:hypothetical protein
MSQPGQGEALVTVSVFLFGKPAWEIDGLEGATVDLELLSEVASCGQELGRRLTKVAEVGKKLLGNGWKGHGLLYDLDFYKAISLKEAEAELKTLSIEPGEVSIREESEDAEGDSYGG